MSTARNLATEYAVLLEPLRETAPDIEAIVAAMKGLEQLDGKLGVRLMSGDEVLEVRAQLGAQAWIYDNLLFVLADHGGDYFGVWLKGQLKGRWSWYRHDEIDLSPLFRNTASFLRAAEAAPTADDIAELAHDYPDVNDTGAPEEHAADREVITAYRAQLAHQATLSEQDADQVLQMFFAFSIMQLTPRADLETLLPFLDDANMWIQERAALVLGDHAYAPARAALEALAAGSGNGALAARGALAKLANAT